VAPLYLVLGESEGLNIDQTEGRRVTCGVDRAHKLQGGVRYSFLDALDDMPI